MVISAPPPRSGRNTTRATCTRAPGSPRPRRSTPASPSSTTGATISAAPNMPRPTCGRCGCRVCARASPTGGCRRIRTPSRSIWPTSSACTTTGAAIRTTASLRSAWLGAGRAATTRRLPFRPRSTPGRSRPHGGSAFRSPCTPAARGRPPGRSIASARRTCLARTCRSSTASCSRRRRSRRSRRPAPRSASRPPPSCASASAFRRPRTCLRPASRSGCRSIPSS